MALSQISPKNSPLDNIDLYINNYFQNKDEFDQHYQKYLSLAQNLTANEMIQIFSKSTIQCNSLQTAFDDKQKSRLRKIQRIKEMSEQLEYLRREDKEVNEFFKKLNIGENIPSYSAHINLKYMTQGIEQSQVINIFANQFPASFEGLKAYSENLKLNLRSLRKNQKIADDMHHHFLTGINGFLTLAVRRQHVMEQQAGDQLSYNEDEKTFLADLYRRYDRSPL